MEISSDMYSSASSDDQGSINSVIHVGEPDEGVEAFAAASQSTISERQRQKEKSMMETTAIPLPKKMSLADMDDDDSSSEDEEERSRREEELARDSDSSTSSEETQIWVQQCADPKPQIPPKPGTYTPGCVRRHSNADSGHNISHTPHRSHTPSNSRGGGGSSLRHSIVSHNSVTGRVETVVLRDDHTNAADSGISNNDSPEVAAASSGESGCHSQAPSVSHSQLSAQSSSNNSHQPPTSPNNSLLQTIPYHGGPTLHSHLISLQPLASPQPSPLPEDNSHTDPAQDMLQMVAHFRESLWNILSGLYALFLIVLGATLPIAEVFASDKIDSTIFEVFYIYLFLMSILFLLYVYIFLLRSRTNLRLRRRNKTPQTHDPLLTKSPARCRFSISDQSHTGSFYLRLGAVGFGIGAMIHEGLMFGQVFETSLSPDCVSITNVMRPVVHLTFTFVQLYFIFMNSKMRIHKYRTFARFGLMHMIATNLCVWLRTIIRETMREIEEHPSLIPWMQNISETKDEVATPSASMAVVELAMDMPLDQHGPAYSSNSTGVPQHNPLPVVCHREEIITSVVELASPYLYPCTVEYSLIAAGILFIMWRNISHPSQIVQSSEQASHSKKQHRVSVDCSGANRGLFFGIFTLVAIIISVIVFFVLIEKPGFKNSAVLLVHSSEIVLYFLAFIAVIVAGCKISDMTFHRHRDNALDETLLIVSLVGVFMFSVFSIIAGRYQIESRSGMLLMASSLLILVQAITQTVFILNGLRRSSRTTFHETKKPGREYITYLLVCNIAMWGINTFEVLRSDSNPIAMEFYGFLPWSIITHITTPLAIFYRFHSTVCLAAVWKNAYKIKAV